MLLRIISLQYILNILAYCEYNLMGCIVSEIFFFFKSVEPTASENEGELHVLKVIRSNTIAYATFLCTLQSKL